MTRKSIITWLTARIGYWTDCLDARRRVRTHYETGLISRDEYVVRNRMIDRLY